MLAYNPSTEEVETRTGAVGQSATSNLCVPVRNNVDNSRGIKPKVAHKPVCTQTCEGAVAVLGGKNFPCHEGERGRTLCGCQEKDHLYNKQTSKQTTT